MKRVCLILLAGVAASAAADLQYTLAPMPAAKSVRMSLTFDARAGENRFAIPAWCPGFYTLKRYYEKISDLRIIDAEGRPILGEPVDQRTWTVRLRNPGKITIHYRVAGDDPGLGFFGTNVQEKTAFVNGPSAFLYPVGRLAEPCRLTIQTPEGWDVATAMDKALDGSYVAGDYDELIDHPIEMGRFQRKSFVVAGIPFEAVFTSTTGTYPNTDATVAELKALSEPAIRMFGGAPFKKYLYIVHLAVGNFGGGLEHRASNVIATGPSSPLRLGTLAAHEFFHAWNVKQIRPKVLGPFDYSRQVRTRNLWFAEGVTDYYAMRTTYLSGVYSEADLLRDLGNEIDALQSSRTRLAKTLEEVCWQTWESTGFGYDDLSYYTKGAVAGLVFDAAIRDATDGAKSLDDVMRLLYSRHRLPKPGFEEDDLRKAVNEVAGADLTALYDRVVRSTQEVPYEVLHPIGLEVLHPEALAWEFGYDLDREGTVSSVVQELEAQGLQEGDRMVRLDGQDVSTQAGEAVAKRSYQATVLRNGLPLTLNLRKIEMPAGAFRLQRTPNLDSRAQRLLDGWLKR